MSVWKKLNKQDSFVTTYVAKKQWNLSGNQLDSAGVKLLPAYSNVKVVAPEDSAELNCSFEFDYIDLGQTCILLAEGEVLSTCVTILEATVLEVQETPTPTPSPIPPTPTPTPTNEPIDITPTPTPTGTVTPTPTSTAVTPTPTPSPAPPTYTVFPANESTVTANSSTTGNNPDTQTVTPVVNVENGEITLRVKLTLPPFNISTENRGEATLSINLGAGVGTQTITTEVQNNSNGTTHYSSGTITIPPGQAYQATLTAWSNIAGGPTSSYAIASIEEV